MAVKWTKGETHAEVKHSSGYSKESHGVTQLVESDGTIVHFSIGHTKNIGNYQSIKFDIGVTMPCTKGEMDLAFGLCNKWADDKLTALVEEVEQDLNG